MIRDLADSYLVVRELADIPEKQEMATVLVRAWFAYAERITTKAESKTKHGMTVFIDALLAAGYTDIDAAWAKWGLDTPMDEEQRRRKLDAIKATGAMTHVSTVNPADAPDTSRCPKCNADGRKFEWGYGCSNKECRNSKSGKGMTWDDNNWSRIRFAVHGR